MMSYVLDPISIATHGYVGLLEDVDEYGFEPMSIAAHGYVTFQITEDGRNHVRFHQQPYIDEEEEEMIIILNAFARILQ